FAAHAGSVGAYAFINDVFYLEATAYRTLDFSTQNDLGTDPFGARGLFDLAPYWRIAFEPHWGNNWLELGTFGMAADVHPWTFATGVQAREKSRKGVASKTTITTRKMPRLERPGTPVRPIHPGAGVQSARLRGPIPARGRTGPRARRKHPCSFSCW